MAGTGSSRYQVYLEGEGYFIHKIVFLKEWDENSPINIHVQGEFLNFLHIDFGNCKK